MLTKHDVSTITRIAIAYADMRFDPFVSHIYKTADFLELIKLIELKLNSFKRGYHIADFLFDEYPADMQSAFDDWMKAEAKNRQY